MSRPLLSRRALLTAAGLAPVVGLAACTGEGPAANQPTTTSDGTQSSRTASTQTGTNRRLATPEEIITGLTTPWGLRSLDENTLLVTERDTGAVKLVRDGRATTIHEVAEASANQEAGLLGLELSKDHRRLFLYVSTTRDNRVLAYDFDGRKPTNPKVILQGIPAAGFHNGGQLALGPDGHLYVSTGDATQRDLAQDKQSLAGKILRITTDGGVPKDNPFGNPVFSHGHRNVQGLTFDDDGHLWAAEFGDKSADEVNQVTLGGNHGWPEAEGHNGHRDGFVAPKVVWEPTASSSPSSLTFAKGQLWVGALMGKCLFQVPLNGTDAGEPVKHFGDQYGRIRSVTPHRDGIVFGTSNTDGRAEPKPGDDRLLYLPL